MRPIGERIATLEAEVVNIKEMLEEQNESAKHREGQLRRIELTLYLLLGGLAVIEFVLRLAPDVIKAFH